MTPKSKRFSLFKRVHHEFLRSFRELESEKHDRQILIQRIQERLTYTAKQAGKNALFFLILAVACTQMSVSDEIEFVTALISVSIPKIYVIAVASFFWCGLVFSFLNLCQYLWAKAVISNNITESTRFDAIKKHLTGDDMVDILSPIRNGSIVRNYLVDGFLTGLVFFSVYVVAGLPVIVALGVMLRELFLSFSVSLPWSLEWSVAIATMGMFYATISYFFIYFTPMRLRKNIQFIRWNFLYHINKDENGFHPSGRRWL